MIHAIRSTLPGGQQLITARLECDRCGARGDPPICLDRPAQIFSRAVHLRITARHYLGWTQRHVREPETGRTVRADLCPGCRRTVRRDGIWLRG